MTKRVLLFALSLFSICIISCVYCDDCTSEEVKLPAYANKSGETVKIIINTESYPPYEKLIANDDTLHYNTEEWHIPEINNCGLATNCDNPPAVRMELYFLDDPVKCLIFDGEIKNDGIDTRSFKSYKKGEVIEKLDFGIIVEYVYTITPELKAIATEENCYID